MARVTGTHERTEIGPDEVDAFVPFGLPPADPPLALDDETAELFRRGQQALARLELAGEMVPSIHWFIYAFVRKEAVVSSQIEGTQATLVDLLTFEAQSGPEATPDADVQEVCNYLDALAHARKQLTQQGRLSIQLLNDTHRVLMTGVRGADKRPGEVRTLQNWIGGARPASAMFVPPPPQHLPRSLTALEDYIHTDEHQLPALVRAGLLHVQFETIHPYLDGNGRIGRLLVTLLLEHYGILSQPLLYLSLFLKRHRDEYYNLLNGVRTDGDWEAWIKFFLYGVATIAEEGIAAARELFALVTRDRTRVLDGANSTVMAVRLFERLPEHPVVTVARVTEILGTTKPTATKAINGLVDAGVLVETTGRKRDRTYSYSTYLEHLRAGTDLDAGP